MTADLALMASELNHKEIRKANRSKGYRIVKKEVEKAIKEGQKCVLIYTTNINTKAKINEETALDLIPEFKKDGYRVYYQDMSNSIGCFDDALVISWSPERKFKFLYWTFRLLWPFWENN